MPRKKPTWQEKLFDSKGYPKVEEIKGGMNKQWGSGTVVIPAPIEVYQLMRKGAQRQSNYYQRNSTGSCN